MMTYTLANRILEGMSGRSSLFSNAIYLGLSTTAPSRDGTGFTELPASNGYKRTLLGMSGHRQLTVHCADIPLFHDAGTPVSLFCTARRFGAVCGALCGACCLFILRKWNFADFFRPEQRNAAPYSDSGAVPCFGVYGACGI